MMVKGASAVIIQYLLLSECNTVSIRFNGDWPASAGLSTRIDGELTKGCLIQT